MAKFLNSDGLARLVALIKQALGLKQNTLVSGTNIKTINGTSILGSGDITTNEIDSVTVVETTASGGRNVVTITDTNGNETTFGITNGRDGVSVGEVGIVDDLDTGGHIDVLSGEMGKVLGNAVFSTKKYTESDLTKGKLWPNHSVNAVADTMSTNANFGCMDLPVVAGDIVTVHSKSSSWHNTTWAITDTSRNILSNADRVDTAVSITLSIKQDGHVFINCANDYYEDFAVYKKYSKTTDIVDEVVSTSHYASEYKNNPLPLWKDTLKVLAIGNSYTEDPTSYIKELISGANIDTSKLCIYIVTQSSSSIQTWVENYEDSTVTKTMTRMAGALTMGTETQNQTSGNYEISGTVKELLAKDWDVVVMQQVSTLAGDIATFDPYLSSMIGYIRKGCTNPKVAIAYQSVWSYKSGRVVSGINYGDNETRWEEICHTTRQMAAKYGIDIIIPTGTAIQNARNTSLNTDGEMTRDGTHLALGVGRYVAACTWFQTLIAPMFGIGIVGNPAVHALTSSEANAEFDYEAVAVDSTNKRLCQLCAFYATVDRWKITTVTAETIDDYDPTYPATIYDRVATLESGQATLTEQTRKVTAEDLAGTSDYIRTRLTENGWELNKYLNSSMNLANSNNNCVSFYIPMSNVAGHSITLYYAIAGSNSNYMAWYNSEKTYVSGCYYVQNANNYRTVTLGTTSSWESVAYLRITLNQSKLNECYVLDNTTGEYYFKGDDYLNSINASNLTLDTFLNKFIVQELGQSKTVAVSQKTITDAINYNINIERGTGFTLNSNSTYRYIKLSPKVAALLNTSDKMSFMFSTRSTGNSQDYRYFRFGNGNTSSNGVDGTNGVYLGWSHSRDLSANGVSYTLNMPNSNTSTKPTPDVWIVTWDRINGVVKFYNRTTLVNTLTSDSYKKTQFVNSENKLAILGGDNNTRIYDIRLFDYDISYLFGDSDIRNEIDYLDGAGILPSQFENNYSVANNDSSFNSQQNAYTGGGYNNATYTWDGDDYHIVVNSGTASTAVCGGKPYYCGRDGRAQILKFNIEVVSGTIKLCWRSNQPSENKNYILILDENGDEIADYDNIGIGKYTVIRTASAVGSSFNFYPVSGSVEVIMKKTTYYKPISCVFHLSGDTMYNKKFYDDQTDSFITLYTDRTCATEYTAHTMVKTPQRVILNTTSNMLPHYSGEMAITGGKVYIGMPDYTWKQINNS